MHDRTVVIIADVEPVGDMLVEIVPAFGRDILEPDRDVLVAIAPALLVPQAERVAELVDGGADLGARRQGKVLLPALAPDIGPAAVEPFDVDPVLVSVVLWNEADSPFGHFRPVAHRGLRQIGHDVVDDVGYDAAGPAKLVALDADAPAPDVAAKNDVTLEYFQPVPLLDRNLLVHAVRITLARHLDRRLADSCGALREELRVDI